MKVLIFGLGLNGGGVGSAKFFAKKGADVKITDLKEAKILKSSIDQLNKFKNITYTLGQHKFEDIDCADLIIKNPGIKQENPFIKNALKKGKRVEQDMGIFLDFVKPEQIIGVTGTKGKSTTVALVYEILKPQGNIILAGNIGKSVLDIIPHLRPKTLVILELSSFQLESFDQHQISPKWAVITNITPDHLNYHKNMNDYVNAKQLITKYQTKDDFLIIRKNDPLVDKENFQKGKAKIIRFSKEDLPAKLKPKLLEEHNLENMAGALSIGKIFKIKPKSATKIFSSFKEIPYRLELIKIWRGVKIYNDTTATSPESGSKALKSLPNSIVIAGGMNKKMSYKSYVKDLQKYAKRVFFLAGDSTDKIKKSMKKKELIAGEYDNLAKLLTAVKKEVKRGDTILFSPAATSFNLFQNEFDRGRKFNQTVKKVFK